MRRVLVISALLATNVWATVPQMPINPWENSDALHRPSNQGEQRVVPESLGPFCYLREYEEISDFLATWQLQTAGHPSFGGMIEAEAGPLGGVIQTDNTLEAIWCWSRRRVWTGLSDRDVNIAAAWTYCHNYPAWLEEGAAGDNYYRAHNCAWALAACREYEAATGDTTYRVYGRTSAGYIATHPLPLSTMNAMVTGWCAGSLYEYALAEGREDWRRAAVEQGLDLLDWVEVNPEARLALDEWAMSGGTILWGLCRSVFAEAPLYGQSWLDDHVFFIPDWSDWHNVAGYDWDSSWNVAYANGLFAVEEAVGDPVSRERATRITDWLLSHDTDDDGGIMADSHDPNTEDMSWVTCYLARFGLSRLIGTPLQQDVGALRLDGLLDEGVVVVGQPLPIRAIVANHGLAQATGVQVALEVDQETTWQSVDLEFADLDTLEFAVWTPALPGRHRLRVWTSWALDADPANDTLALDLVALAPPLAMAKRQKDATTSRLHAAFTDDGLLQITAAAGSFHLTLFNLLGQKVMELTEEVSVAGTWTLSWREQCRSLARGTYLMQIEGPGDAVVLRVPLFD